MPRTVLLETSLVEFSVVFRGTHQEVVLGVVLSLPIEVVDFFVLPKPTTDCGLRNDSVEVHPPPERGLHHRVVSVELQFFEVDSLCDPRATLRANPT